MPKHNVPSSQIHLNLSVPSNPLNERLIRLKKGTNTRADIIRHMASEDNRLSKLAAKHQFDDVQQPTTVIEEANVELVQPHVLENSSRGGSNGILVFNDKREKHYDVSGDPEPPKKPGKKKKH